MMWCTQEPHLQAWGMMQAWGVTERPEWQRDYIARINASVRTAIARGAFR